MNQLPKYLARDLNIRCNTRVHTLQHHDNDGWQLRDDQGNALGDYDWVISTAPPSQTLALFTAIDGEQWQWLAQVPMMACYALMLGFKQQLSLPFDVAVVKGEVVSWLANNSSKPQRPDQGTCVLIHAANRWAEAHVDDDIDEVREALHQAANRLLGLQDTIPDHIACHRWRYANMPLQSREPPYAIDPSMRLAACGDWCIQGRVEAAFTSAQALHQAMQQWL